MPDWGLWDSSRVASSADTATSAGSASIAANASANTKATSFTQLIASTAFEAAWMTVAIAVPGTTAKYLVDIGIGAAASETVLIANLPLSGASTAPPFQVFTFPVSIPSGTRISARSQASTGSSACRVQVVLTAGAWASPAPLGRFLTMGADTTDSGGVAVDPGTSANTKGAYTTVYASTDFALKWLCVHCGHDAAANATANLHMLVDIAVGAAAAEQIVIPDFYNYFPTAVRASLSPPLCLPVGIPAGTRLSARAQASGATATERLFDVVLIGVG